MCLYPSRCIRNALSGCQGDRQGARRGTTSATTTTWRKPRKKCHDVDQFRGVSLARLAPDGRLSPPKTKGTNKTNPRGENKHQPCSKDNSRGDPWELGEGWQGGSVEQQDSGPRSDRRRKGAVCPRLIRDIYDSLRAGHAMQKRSTNYEPPLLFS
jgi:hypothetical protein